MKRRGFLVESATELRQFTETGDVWNDHAVGLVIGN